MPSTVKLPIIGQANKGTVIGVGIGGAAVSAYLIARQLKKSKQASAAAASAATAAQSAGYGYGTTGYGYGTTGYYGYGEQSTYGYGASGGFPAGYYGYGVPEPPGAGAATTNAQWTQAAITQLEADGYDASTVAAALGLYETGQAVTAAQAQIVEAAIGIEGYPPDAGANGYPPSINQQGTPGGGTGGGQSPPPLQGGNPPTPVPVTGGAGPTPTTKVPNVVGEEKRDAGPAIKAVGLIPKFTSTSEGTISKQSPKAGLTRKQGDVVTLTVKPK